MADSTTTLNPKMSWRLKLSLPHSMLSQVIYRKSLHPEKNPKEAISSLVARYLSPPHRDTKSGGCPASALSVDAARNGKTVQTAFGKGIETYLDIIAAQM